MRMLLPLLLLGLVTASEGQSAALIYDVWEERPPDTLVGNLTRDTDLLKRWSVEQVRQMTFTTMIQHSSRYGEYFTVDQSLGIIRTNRIIDRDRICSQSLTCEVDLTIRIDPIQYFEIIKVKIIITDRNDNPPTFSSQHIERSMIESASIGTRITIPSAEDLDSGNNGIKQYALEPANSPFMLDSSDFDTSASLSLVLQARLDREVKDFYKLTVTARDGGSPPLTGSMVIDIFVLDANDNNPIFDNQTYEASLYENTPTMTTVIRVHATDLDVGLNGDVLYSFAPATSTEFGQLFGINNISGDIYLKQPLDYEQQSSYTLSVVVNDRGVNSLSAYVTVVVNVKDINDNAPVIVINTLNEKNIATVEENSPAGMFVAHVSVTDADSTDNTVNCSLDSIQFEMSQLFQSEYKIITKTTFDREQQSEYHVNLVCQDSGTPPRTSTKYLAIVITDANDHAPKFYENQYSVSVAENLPVGVSLIRFNATDGDISKNAAILYKVRDDDQKWVNIDLVSGVVTTSSVYDYEKQNTFEVLVTATDQGIPPMSATATLHINVLDVNDNVPKFSTDTYSFYVKENSEAGGEVGRISAAYTQEDVQYEIVYRIQGPLSDIPFAFDRGVLYTTAKLDREDKSPYKFQISASNAKDTRLLSLANVTVFVTDVNDNAPLITFPNNTNNYLEISSRTKENTALLAIKAHDPDEGPNGRLTYKVTDSSCNMGLFGVDPNTGVVFLATPINMTATSRTCEVHIGVKDGGSPSLSSSVILVFHINDTVPYISGPAYTTATSEIANGTFIDPDAATNKRPFWNTSTMFGIGIAVAVFVITVIVLVAVAIIKQRRKAKDKSHRYNCRLQEQKVLKTPPISQRNGVGNGHIYNYEGPNRSTMTLDIDVGESNTDDMGEWPVKVNPDLIQVTKGRDLLGRPSPTSSSLSSKIQDSGVDLSWQDQGPQVWSGQDVPRLHRKAPLPSAVPHANRDSTPLTQIELQVQDMLHMLQKDKDSETGSFTDSGKGPSEEGDQGAHIPPLEPHYTTVKQAGRYDIPLVAEAHQMALRVMDDYRQGEPPHRSTSHRKPEMEPQQTRAEPYRMTSFQRPRDQKSPPVRRHHSDNIPARVSKARDFEHRLSYTPERRDNLETLHALQSSPASNDSGTDHRFDTVYDNPVYQGFHKLDSQTSQRGLGPPDYKTAVSDTHRHSKELKPQLSHDPRKGQPANSGVLLRSPRDKQAGKHRGSPGHTPFKRNSSTPPSPGYTVGPVEICVKNVVNKYLPKGQDSRLRVRSEEEGGLSDATTTSGSYIVNNEELRTLAGENWARDSITV